LFSLINKHNKPAKFDFNGRGRSIYCSVGYGPTFGGYDSGLPDLYIATCPNKNRRSYSALGSSYENKEMKSGGSQKISEKFDQFLLADSFHFQVEEIEIYEIC
jgi:hypothetical protein